MSTRTNATNHHYAQHHRGTEVVPFDNVLGITPDGVPVMSNGDESYFSNMVSLVPGCIGLSSSQRRCPCKLSHTTTGYRWQCVEFVRRYLAARKAVWMSSIATAEDAWTCETLFTSVVNNAPVGFTKMANNSVSPMPSVGDVIVWSRCEAVPFGHMAIVTNVRDEKVYVAEQNQGFERWTSDMPYSREIPMRIHADRAVELVDEDPVLGWISVSVPFYDFTTGDIGDLFRVITDPGTITRKSVPPRVDLPWITTNEGCDYYLRRSLIGSGSVANVQDVPSAFYYIDYNMWCRIGRAATSLHRLAMDSTRQVLESPDATHLLEHYFGVPREIQPLLRRSWELTPPLGGRFDFGYDGQRIVMLEYNCDSSGALLECCDTQERMAQSYGVTTGASTGSFWSAKCLSFFEQLQSNGQVCPCHNLIHFMIDDDDEERYTAMTVMRIAEEAGFRTKLQIKVPGFAFRDGSPVNAAPKTVSTRHATIVDADGEEVLLVWKSWSWDTVLHQFAEQQLLDEMPSTPTLSDILLNNNVRVFEPLWKAITGSKAILPFMYARAQDHENMLPASFDRTKEIISTHHVSKPVNGRAGQNIAMHDPVTAEDALSAAPEMDFSAPVSPHLLSQSVRTPYLSQATQSFDGSNECSPGKFFDSVLVYQQRLFLKRFEGKYFPIFCGWVIGDEFSGVVVREDTSKITELASVVVPARVVRHENHVAEQGPGNEVAT